MSVVGNLRGTSSSVFQIGKSGSAIYSLGIDPTISFSVDIGDIWVDLSDGQIKIWNGSEWDIIILSDRVQTITGAKTFEAPTVISDDTEATGPETGALQVDGGVNIAKNLVLEGTLVQEHSTQQSFSLDLSTVAETTIDTFSTTNFRTAKYIVQITQGSSYQSSELIVVHDGSSAYSTEYAVIETNGSLGSLIAKYDNGDVNLAVTMESGAQANIKVYRTLVAI